MRFLATRQLSVRLHSRQRFLPDEPVVPDAVAPDALTAPRSEDVAVPAFEDVVATAVEAGAAVTVEHQPGHLGMRNGRQVLLPEHRVEVAPGRAPPHPVLLVDL